MRTAIVTTTYLDPQERYDKTIKFIEYYNKKKPEWEIVVLDNCSPRETFLKFTDQILNPGLSTVISFPIHFDRPSHLDYKYLWRAVHYIQKLFNMYDKIIYMDNDFYLLSDRIFEHIDKIDSGWHTFWCEKHKFPETGIHIVTKDSQEYKNFVNMPMDDFIKKYNGQTMETVLPCKVNKDFIGDRYSEYPELPKDFSTIDFFAQTRLEDKI